MASMLGTLIYVTRKSTSLSPSETSNSDAVLLREGKRCYNHIGRAEKTSAI